VKGKAGKWFVILFLASSLIVGVAFLILHRPSGIATGGSDAGIPARVTPVEKKRKVGLMFSDDVSEKLKPEYRVIEKGNMEQEIRKTVEELIIGPKIPNLSSTLPGNARLNSLRIDGDMLVLDFSDALMKQNEGGSYQELAAVFSIVNTITDNFAAVKKVRLLVDGRERETLAGHVAISEPLERLDEIMGDAR
jgi:germination protein M